MTQKSKDPRFQLLRLSDLLIEDLLLSSDADLLETMSKSGSAGSPGDKAKNAFRRAQQVVGQKKLLAARAAIDSKKVDSENISRQSINIPKARLFLQKLATNDPLFQNKITLAARNLSDISDAEILSIIEDLKRLGALPEGSI